MSPAALRLFVAIPIPEAVRSELAGVQNELRPLAAPRDVRWTPPAQLHLTLKFLGSVPEERLDTVKKSLAGACAGASPFWLRAQGIGFFPGLRATRVIWAGFHDDLNALPGLQSKVEESLAPFAENVRSEKFLPHATLGRFQKYRLYKTEKLLPRALAFADRVFGEWQVEGVSLFRSELSPEGARHSLLGEFTLGAG